MALPSVLRASVTADTLTSEGDAATVLIDGADTACTANGLAHYAPTPGDRLLVQRVGGAVEVMQFLSRGTVPWGSGGGNVVYSQSTEPSTGSEHDLWYDTGDENHPYIRIAGVWTDNRDGEATAALTAALSKGNPAIITTGDPIGTPSDGDEWVKVDGSNVVLGRWYGSGGAWVSTQIGTDWLAAGSVIADTLEDNLELSTHIVTPAHSGIYDWTITPPTVTVGSSATTGGALDKHVYQYWVMAVVGGLHTQPSPVVSADLTGSSTTTNTQDISWTSVAGATGYRIYRLDATAGGVRYVQTVGAVTTFTDLGDTSTIDNFDVGRVDINSSGINLYDGFNELTTHLDNNGGVTFIQQTAFQNDPDSPDIVMEMGAQDTSSATAFDSHIYFDLGGITAASPTIDYEKDTSTDYWQFSVGAGNMSLAFYSDTSGHTGPKAMELYGPDDGGVTGLSCFADGSVEFNGVTITYGESASTHTFYGHVSTENNQVAVVGEVKMVAFTSAPSGWHVCDGTAVSRTTYAALFTAIGTTFGAGDGSTTFNLPDMRGKFPLHHDGTHSLGATGGSFTHTITTSEMPSHTHGVGTLAATDAGHTHAAGTYTIGSHSHTAGTIVVDSHTHGNGTLTVGLEFASTTSTGGSAIRVTDVGNTTGGAGTNETASIGGSTAAAAPGTSGSTGVASPSLTGSSATGTASISLSGSTDSAGSGSAMDITNPYLALTFIIYAGV